MDDRLYRRTQRQLGEIQVAFRLLGDLFKARPDLPGLKDGVGNIAKAKEALFAEVVAMEQVQGMD